MFKELLNFLGISHRSEKSRTVRYAFPLVVLAFMFAGASSVITSDKSYITVETTPTIVNEGESFFINITATAHTPVNAIDIVLEYPKNQIEITGIDTGESVITLWAEDPYAKDGSVYLRGGTFGKGFIGEHEIVKVRAKAIESGAAHVTAGSVKFVAGDGDGTEVDVSDVGQNKSKIYIANEDGSLVGIATVKIITDVDGDGDVDLTDISSFMAAWFDKSIIFDFNGDGRMNFKDFSILLADSFLN